MRKENESLKGLVATLNTRVAELQKEAPARNSEVLEAATELVQATISKAVDEVSTEQAEIYKEVEALV